MTDKNYSESRQMAGRKSSRLLLLLGTLILLCGMLLAGRTRAFAAGNLGITFHESYYRTANTSPKEGLNFYNPSAFAIDTYNGTDSYTLSLNSNSKNYRGGSQVLITMNAPNGHGGLKVVREVRYSAANLGAANDATVYQNENGKYLFVAVSSNGKQSAKASDGTSIDVGVIRLDEFMKGKATVYPLTTDINYQGTKGITYCGKETVDGTQRDIFVCRNGVVLFKCWLEYSGNSFRLHNMGPGHNETVTTPGGKKVGATAVCYHKGYIYMAYAGSSSSKNTTYSVILRAPMSELFNGEHAGWHNDCPVDAYVHDFSLFNGLRYTQVKSVGLGFASLEGSDPMYLCTARAGGTGSGMFCSVEKF